jgi:hypothetical protein
MKMNMGDVRPNFAKRKLKKGRETKKMPQVFTAQVLLIYSYSGKLDMRGKENSRAVYHINRSVDLAR